MCPGTEIQACSERPDLESTQLLQEPTDSLIRWQICVFPAGYLHSFQVEEVRRSPGKRQVAQSPHPSLLSPGSSVRVSMAEPRAEHAKPELQRQQRILTPHTAVTQPAMTEGDPVTARGCQELLYQLQASHPPQGAAAAASSSRRCVHPDTDTGAHTSHLVASAAAGSGGAEQRSLEPQVNHRTHSG